MVSHQDFPSRPVPKAKPGQSITLDRLPPEILGKIFYWLFRQEWPRGMDVMFMEDRLFIKDRKAGSLGELDPAHACKALFVAAIQQIFPATTVYMNLNRDFFATNKLLDLPVYENFQGPPYVSRLRNILHLEIIVKDIRAVSQTVSLLNQIPAALPKLKELFVQGSTSLKSDYVRQIRKLPMREREVNIREQEVRLATGGLISVIDTLRELAIRKKMIGLSWNERWEEVEDMREEDSRIVAKWLLAESAKHLNPYFIL
ncbi:hypothetical protein LTR37_001549 [Vermiconidia calcicola]|uniref:Uncharacterized protein n=1 Tax=Vermiconidia calcicola TaxID=1690605 RepID=A0ACC3NVJ2_9PEZI|nr:hypothetical protein LTR37_001549 [Vermiconidia calcicola]